MTVLTSLKQLHYLVAISEQLNFTRAAQSCFVTQSTLSAALKELEDVLRTRLVGRDRQSVLMTPIGLEVEIFIRKGHSSYRIVVSDLIRGASHLVRWRRLLRSEHERVL